MPQGTLTRSVTQNKLGQPSNVRIRTAQVGAWTCVCRDCHRPQAAISMAHERPPLCPTSSGVSRVCPGSSYSFFTRTFFSPAAPLAAVPAAAGFSSSFIAFLLGPSAKAGRFLGPSAELGRAALGLAAFACGQKGRQLTPLAISCCQ